MQSMHAIQKRLYATILQDTQRSCFKKWRNIIHDEEEVEGEVKIRGKRKIILTIVIVFKSRIITTTQQFHHLQEQFNK